MTDDHPAVTPDPAQESVLPELSEVPDSSDLEGSPDLRPRRSGLAVASAVVSTLSVVVLFPVLALVGAGLGVVALNRLKRSGAGGFRWAVAGIVIGVVWFVVATIILIVTPRL